MVLLTIGLTTGKRVWISRILRYSDSFPNSKTITGIIRKQKVQCFPGSIHGPMVF